ncbi:hypothetical protein OIU92_23545 [Escherichia coli]|nr:hypothetical protein [Escherichia coli]
MVTHDQVNKLRAYWECRGVYVLILIPRQSATAICCDEQNDALLSLMTTKNYGANYAMWQHPLTPYRVPLKEGASFTPLNHNRAV